MNTHGSQTQLRVVFEHGKEYSEYYKKIKKKNKKITKKHYQNF